MSEHITRQVEHVVVVAGDAHECLAADCKKGKRLPGIHKVQVEGRFKV